jgi:hypothetical protein
MKSRLRNIVRSITFGIIGVTSLFGVSKAQAATSYPIVNGQLVRFELSNGVALNIQTASLANDKPIYSFTGNNSDPEQIFKVISNGDGYNFQRNNTGYSLSASTLTPANLSPAVAYQSGFGQWQDFWLDDAPGGGYYLIKWRKDPNYCLNVPGSQSNVKITFFQCNAGDNDQRFRIVNIANQQYVNAVSSNFSSGVLEAASGYRVSMSGANTTPQKVLPNDNDPNQKIQFQQVGGNQYVFQKANTNYALSSNTLDYVTANTPGMAMTTYTTGAGRWQNFGFVYLGNDWYQVKYAWNPNYCMSMQATSNLVAILPCNSSDNNQRFRVFSKLWEKNYAYIFARANASTFDPGHAWFATVKLYGNADANSIQIQQGSDVKTYSAWPSNATGNPVVPTLNYASDVSQTMNILNGQNTSSLGLWTFRGKVITPSLRDSIAATLYKNTGCTYYGTGSGGCTCVTQATKMWYNIFGEDMRGLIAPALVYDKINELNRTNP